MSMFNIIKVKVYDIKNDYDGIKYLISLTFEDGYCIEVRYDKRIKTFSTYSEINYSEDQGNFIHNYLLKNYDQLIEDHENAKPYHQKISEWIKEEYPNSSDDKQIELTTAIIKSSHIINQK